MPGPEWKHKEEASEKLNFRKYTGKRGQKDEKNE